MHVGIEFSRGVLKTGILSHCLKERQTRNGAVLTDVMPALGMDRIIVNTSVELVSRKKRPLDNTFLYFSAF